MSWHPKDGEIVYEDDSAKVTMTGDMIYKEEFAKRYFLNPYILKEWEKYKIKVKDKISNKYLEKDDVNVFFGENEAKYDEVGEYWSLVFKNYIGKSRIRIYVKNLVLPFLHVEVISTKLNLDENDELFYPEFFRKLVDSLTEYQLTLPFEITSPTFIAVDDIPFPPDLPILFHQIMDNHDRIVDGIQTVLANPHRDLKTERKFVALSEAECIDADVCISILHHPGQLVKPKSPRSSLCSKLKGFVPEKLEQSRNIETFDTPENRFVKQFIKELLHFMKKIEDLVLREKYKEKLGSQMEQWTEIKTILETALLSKCLQQADDSYVPPIITSQVLLKRDGYRELMEARNNLLLSKSPIFTYLKDIIDQRNIAEMYEFWCFFELSKRLRDQEVLAKRENFRIEVETTLEGSLAQSKAKTVIGDYELIYNKKFMRSRKGSYSVPLKPDFSLVKNDKILVVFDSKFRFDVKDQELESSPAEDYEEDAIKKFDVERMAKISDIFKMHTYRDALGAKCAAILYPGNQNVFFSKSESEKKIEDFEQIFRKICGFEEGVAYLTLVPE